VMLIGVPEEDIFRIAVARHFGKFKPSSNVPFEAEIHVPVQERIIVVRTDVFELLHHTRHTRAITLNRAAASSRPCPGPRPESGPSDSRLCIMRRQATACLLGRPCKRQRASLHNTHASSGGRRLGRYAQGRWRHAWRAADDIPRGPFTRGGHLTG
jgi:hypothetical protein